jgi:voltage-gated potassium channel
MKSESLNKTILSLSMLAAIMLIGISGYMIIEGFSFTESFFMTVITIATVGFREVHPLSPQGMWFTALLIIFSFGIFAYVVSNFTRYALDGVLTNYYKEKRVKKKIRRLKDHVVICGYGRNGRQAAVELLEHQVPIIVVEKDVTTVEQFDSSPQILFLSGDATQDEILEQCQLGRAKALITTLPFDADNLFVVLTAREKNPRMTIISRASDERTDPKLKRAGATHVIMPDRIGGQQMAKMVAKPDVVEFLDFIMLQSVENVMLEEISCENISEKFEGKPIRELDVENESGANIIGIKRSDGGYVINPLHETLITQNDKLFVLGTKGQVSSLIRILCSGEQ